MLFIKTIIKNNKTLEQLITYFFVSFVALFFDFFILYFLTDKIGLHYLLSASVGFIFGLVVNYLLSKWLVFKKITTRNKLLEFLIFSFIGIVGLVINNFLVWFFTDIFSVYYLFSKLVSAIFVFLWNFFIRKWALFNH